MSRFVGAQLSVSEGDSVIDSLETWWDATTGPLPPLALEDAMRVGGDVKAPTLVKRVEPLYPEKARQARLSGAVILQMVIDRTGVVRRIQVLRGLPRGLSEAAAHAVMQWELEPGTRFGQPVDILFNLTTNFKLSDAAPEPRGP